MLSILKTRFQILCHDQNPVYNEILFGLPGVSLQGNIVSGNGLVPSFNCNKPLPEPMMTQDF